MSHPQATLCYIVKDGRVLLIHKKRGIGAGKINGPGGKVDANESPLAAAIRETREEVGVVPVDARLGGELWFHFDTGQTSHCLVFLARDCEGVPHETDEAVPEWFPLEALPYERMWEDDASWLPLLLSGRRFHGIVDVCGEKANLRSLSILISD